MSKPINCCVPGCLNNSRNTSGLLYYRITEDHIVTKEDVRLLQNDSLQLHRDNMRICVEHFERGRKRDSSHLRAEPKMGNKSKKRLTKGQGSLEGHESNLIEICGGTAIELASHSSESIAPSYHSIGTQTEVFLPFENKSTQAVLNTGLN